MSGEMESAAGSQNHCVHIENIPFDATEEEMIQICEEIGPVVSFRLPLDRKTSRSKGYGFCEYRDEETALSACRNLEGCVINGHVLKFDILKYVKGADGKRGQKPSQAPVHQIPGLYQQPFAGGQSHDYHHQLKLGTSFPISSPRSLQASSPQISHHSSTQIDHHALSPNLTKAGTPKQSLCSHFVAPYPSTPIMTPGISASPLLAESMSQEESPPTATTMPRTSAFEQPVSRLIKAVQSLSPKSHRKSVSDITSIVSMVDRIPCSTPGNGSSSVDGEDGGDTMKKMKRYISVMPLNNVSSDGSINDNFMKFDSLDSSEMEATATSVKRPKLEVKQALQEEIREINQQLIDMEVSICDEDSESAAAAFEDGEGIIVKCSFTAVAFSPSLKAHFASMHVSPVAPLRLLVPANYPKSSPLLLDNLPVEPSEEFEDFYIKAKSRFSRSLRGLSEQISLGEMAAAWDACVRKVIVEYAQQAGGGSFSSVYGGWENCSGA